MRFNKHFFNSELYLDTRDRDNIGLAKSFVGQLSGNGKDRIRGYVTESSRRLFLAFHLSRECRTDEVCPGPRDI